MSAHRGMSFMDVIVGTALLLIVFTGLIGLLRSSLQVTALAKTRGIATALAESHMEYIRSLSYDSVGTVGGIPAGIIPQNATTTQNGLSFSTRTFIGYKDDSADGFAAADTNGITTDYKEIKVSVRYTVASTTRSIDLISNYAPPGLETTTNGGTLRVNVVNALGAGVSGANVRIINASSSPTIDLTTFSDTDGVVYLPGAPTSTQYQIFVSKSGYSSAQTYPRDATNQNPTPGYLTVVQNQTTTGTFGIDLLTVLTVKTFLPIATSTWSDTFSSGGQLANTTNTEVSGGSVVLAGGLGAYAPSGNARSVPVSPTLLHSWSFAAATSSIPSGTSLSYQVVDGNGTLLPDTALPGNAGGFTGTINLSGVSTSTYPSLALRANLTTNSITTTPGLTDWSITYRRGPLPLPGIPFTLTGEKAIGTTGAGVPLVKTTLSTSTNATALAPLTLEWDSYALGLPGFDTIEACNAPPYELAPGTTNEASLILASSTPTMFLVSVQSATGPLAGASVTLTRTGFSQTVTTTSCGSAYFGSLTGSSAYALSVSKAGYTTFSASAISIAGHVFYAASLE